MPKKPRFTKIRVRIIDRDDYPNLARSTSNRFSRLSDEDRLDEIVRMCASLLIQGAMDSKAKAGERTRAA